MNVLSTEQLQAHSKESIRSAYGEVVSDADLPSDDSESVAGVCGSIADDETARFDIVPEDTANRDDITVASSIESLGHEENTEIQKMNNDLDDTIESREVMGISPFYHQQIGKCVDRDETYSKELRVERHADRKRNAHVQNFANITNDVGLRT
ncbi:hypothetical protein GN244_ATG17685 [Phytophthora infestans]|uniref:Uncharacterized protein n=1 Tax=Phytophthora infestans TaxID=4787 RepID=A0A833SQP3_PHYIN|nr:hypothetical protein GN244_ATG17685 [Phytophthora infestans]